MIAITIRASDDPIARLRGEWQLDVNGERWFGPDSLMACIEAQRTLTPIIRDLAMPS